MVTKTGGWVSSRIRYAVSVLVSTLASAYVTVTVPYFLLLRFMHRALSLVLGQPLGTFGFLVPLLTVLLGKVGGPTGTVPPLLVLALVMALAGMGRGWVRLKRTVYENRISLGLYAIVLASEVLALLWNEDFTGYPYLLGRVGFVVIALMVAPWFRDLRSLRVVLFRFTVGVAVLGVLTVLHALRVFSLPFAMAYLPSRTMFGFRFPFPRTLGIAMSYGKFGIMASAALATLVFSMLSPCRLIKGLSTRVALFPAVIAGVAVAQGRGVFLTVAFTTALAIGLSLRLRRGKTQRASTTGKGWSRASVISLAGLMLLAGFLLTPAIGDSDLLDVRTAKSQLNLAGRVEANRLAVQAFLTEPVFGIGHGNLLADAGMVSVHNNFLEQFVSTGVVGGLAYLAFHLLILARAWEVFDSAVDGEVRAAAGVLLVAVAATFLEYQLFPGFLTEVFAFVSGLVMSAYAHHHSAVTCPGVARPAGRAISDRTGVRP